ncbi:response regulator receiver modulated metal dependent phosphohydrolase [Paracidovorax wautersii]|uniref:Response regulator receiver modulated metal dependent phosphohydrolase n=2 Tax=Paracidovorax wautersii TaxID=1177982 RepID=A0A1I2AQF1_9BURK|nr:response regulator receiver modulated metal dependent phosphohydrolase [Paracidovorax wautersii]
MTAMTLPDHRPRLLLVDDEPANLQVLRQVLQQDYRLLFATSGPKAVEIALQQRPDLMLLDVMMPDMDGYAVLQRLAAEPQVAGMPVIFVTALSDAADEARGLELGAVDYIAKPISAAVVRARVRTHLSLVRMDELRESRLQILQRLGRAAEYKDNETGKHVIRMSLYAQMLALAIGMDSTWAEDLLHAAPLHDVGKIGIPDAVLRKPGGLDATEWDVMRTHPSIGAEIIGEHPGGVLRLASTIALTHHEKWDGSGYPRGLVGREIPLESRIIAIADVFDALTTRRPYKDAWNVEDAMDYLHSQAGRHFDPDLVGPFSALKPQLLQVREQWAE